MPKYMYPYETYPDYLGEAGYFMSVDVARALYRVALITSYIYLEDVFITGNRIVGSKKFSFKLNCIHGVLICYRSVRRNGTNQKII